VLYKSPKEASMTVLITGAGLIGSYAAAQLVEMGQRPVLYEVAPSLDNLRRLVDLNQVEVVRGDILDFPDLVRAAKEHGVDRIIHTAALLTRGSRERAYTAIKVNILGTANVLETARLLGLRRVVFTSSATVYYGTYTAPSPDPQEEDFPLRAVSQKPKGIYPTTKLACEHLGLNYSQLYGMEFVVVRFAGVFGPWKGPVAGGPGTILKELVERPFGEKRVVVEPDLTWLGPEEFLYMKDAAASTVLAAFAPQPTTQVYNVSMGRTYEFGEVLEILQDIYPEVEFQVEEIGQGAVGQYPDIPKRPLDLSRAKEELGYQPQYDMARSLREYRDWLERNR
jgi:nucleoside-diphosphate-sugar epimerase